MEYFLYILIGVVLIFLVAIIVICRINKQNESDYVRGTTYELFRDKRKVYLRITDTEPNKLEQNIINALKTIHKLPFYPIKYRDLKRFVVLLVPENVYMEANELYSLNSDNNKFDYVDLLDKLMNYSDTYSDSIERVVIEVEAFRVPQV